MSRDTIQRFLLENSDVRGVLVHLDQTFQTILQQHAYPKSVQKQLAAVLLAVALLSACIKLKGRMTLQFQSKGAIKMLVGQINDAGDLRGLAKWQHDADPETLTNGLRDGQLVITVFQENYSEPL